LQAVPVRREELLEQLTLQLWLPGTHHLRLAQKVKRCPDNG
jgi:hypothetical protein